MFISSILNINSSIIMTRSILIVESGNDKYFLQALISHCLKANIQNDCVTSIFNVSSAIAEVNRLFPIEFTEVD